MKEIFNNFIMIHVKHVFLILKYILSILSHYPYPYKRRRKKKEEKNDEKKIYHSNKKFLFQRSSVDSFSIIIIPSYFISFPNEEENIYGHDDRQYPKDQKSFWNKKILFSRTAVNNAIPIFIHKYRYSCR